jgi:CPA1 family monovalent cation:H+ antiporter
VTSPTIVGSGETTLELIRLFVLLVGAAALVTLLARRIRLPYTVALVAFGIAAGALAPLRVEITPELVLVVLLPGLIFEASYQTDFGKLRPSIVGVSLLAGPGVLVSASIVAAALHFGAGLDLPQAFVVGAMLSATDPAAVIATFKRLESPRRLTTLVEAESVFNDGTGIVVFALAVDFVSRPVGPAEIGLVFVWVTLISAVMGAVAGLVASRILPTVGDHLIEISLSVVLAYGTYLAADAFHLSGVIATAVAGIVLGTYGRKNGLSPRTEEALDTVWEFVAFLATAFVFLVVGFAISIRALADVASPIAWAFVATLAGRAVIVYGLLGGWRLVQQKTRSPNRIRKGAPELLGRRSTSRDEAAIPLDWLHVIFWSGLRGAVSTALALSLPLDFPNRSALQGITFGVVLVTLLLQATTAELVVARWGHDRSRSETAGGAGSTGSAGRNRGNRRDADPSGGVEPLP